MTDVLERAKALQRNIAAQTSFSMRLDLLEDMIAEIEKDRADRPLSIVRGKAERREEKP